MKNSINKTAEINIINNENVLELLSKINQAINSSESFITVTTKDINGVEQQSTLPSIGFLTQKLNILYENFNKLAGINAISTLRVIPNGPGIGSGYKRIITADLNTEPKAIGQLNPVSTFKVDPNWIFDKMLNPSISVEIDLTNKIDDNIKTVYSKRFIVEFDSIIAVDDNGNQNEIITEDGKLRLAEFNTKYKNNSNIDIVEFVKWLDSPGLKNRIDENLVDQEYYRLEPNKLQYKGNFSVLNTEIDTLNKKLWYVLDTLTYYDISSLETNPKPIELKVGDELTIAPNENGVRSVTVYKVIEISTITSKNRVRVERVFGEEPIPVKQNSLLFYSNILPKRSVKINIGYDEYSVIFLKQIDDISNIAGFDYSPGIGLYSNELKLNDINGETLQSYYINNVNDYGLLLDDLAKKKIPNVFAVKPNAPVLNQDNFKVVQINEYLTNSSDAEKLRDLNNRKNVLTNEIEQIQLSIDNQNNLLNKTNSTINKATFNKIKDQIVKLNSDLANKLNTKSSLTAEILANSKNANKIKPIYHLRGFFPFPQAKSINDNDINNTNTINTKPQEVIQFEIWYRKKSKSGNENPILTIQDLNNNSALNANDSNTTINPNTPIPKVVNGSFSNWIKYKTDVRKRVQDKATGNWLWQIEDVSDSNTPNINQVDIEILPDEIIELKIKSISEVGYPETIVESDFSDTLTIAFPDELKSILNDDEFILKDAQMDDIKTSFVRELESKGYKQHLNDSFTNNNNYYSHIASSIASGFTDVNGNVINLFDYINKLQKDINTLTDIINKGKGSLEVYLVNNGNKTKVINGSNININLILEDYLTKTQVGLASNPITINNRTYKNELTVINNYTLQLLNASDTSNLGVLSFRGYGRTSYLQPSSFAYDFVDSSIPNIKNSSRVQATFVSKTNTLLYNIINENNNTTSAPKFATQSNNQFIWLQQKAFDGNYIYDNTNKALDYNNIDNNPAELASSMLSNNKNIGLMANISNTVNDVTIPELIDTNIALPAINSLDSGFGTTVHPALSSLNDVTEKGNEYVKTVVPGTDNAINIPLYNYFKFDLYSQKSLNIITNQNVTLSVVDPSTNAPESNSVLITNINAINISPNDYIILSGLTGVYEQLNNKLLLVLASSNNSLTLAIKLEYTNTTQTCKLEQVHKKYTRTNNGTDIEYYTVYGNDILVDNYMVIKGNTNPQIHNKKIRFYLEDNNNVRPFDFQVTFNMQQYSKTGQAILNQLNQTTSTIN